MENAEQFDAEREALLDAERAKRRKLEARLLKSLWRSEGHRRLAESNIIGVMFGDTDGGISGANDEFLRIIGYTRDSIDVRTLRWENLTPPEHRTKDAQAMEELGRHGIALPWEKEYISRTGERVPVLVGAAMLEGSNHQLIGFVIDLTERKRAEQRAARYASALRARNEEMEADLRMARELQSSYLPQVPPCFPAAATPQSSALRFHHRYVPAGEVGGDLFDIVAVSEREAGVLVCDVMGHGVRAALVTAMIRTSFEHLAASSGDPSQLLHALNGHLLRALRHTGSPIFVTACYAVIDVSTGSIKWANAGHPGPIVLRGNKTTEALTESRGPALGLVEGPEYPTEYARLEPNDTLLLYTDGLYDLIADQDPAKLVGHLQTILPAASDVLLARLLEGAPSVQERDDVCVVAAELVRRA
ncbi:MAG: PP2C family protein-serine/threonine phosphatase [Myxococcaceae bacterium]